jgi:hypothetical protein
LRSVSTAVAVVLAGALFAVPARADTVRYAPTADTTVGRAAYARPPTLKVAG